MTMISKTAGQPEPRARTMAGPSVKQFLDILRQARILDAEQLEAVTRDILPKLAEPRGLARELVKRGWLTAFQVNQVSQGRAKDLLVGQYLILERLGEGGMGQVYKARHKAMGRVVALKVMRPERLANTDAVNRFKREIRAASQLSHPNVVLAYDADEVNGQHYFAMEFVEGVDLSRLVKSRGPLPIKAACDYILQAAQGLKHAHERGLVHRDIKPANLLVTPVPQTGKEIITVKILDMGLARLGEISDDSAYTQLTQDGKVVGTPDYISPEQARDSRKADIRSDLYSLGCTLYFLLTAKVPFPGGGSVMEKLMKHQMEEPVPIESVRPEVPEKLRAVLKKLITKKPENRYQTPGEVVVALEPFVFGNGVPAGSITEAMPAVPVAVPVAPAPMALPITPDFQAATTPGPIPNTPAALESSDPVGPSGPSAGSKAAAIGLMGLRGLAKATAWLAVLMVKPGPDKPRRVMRIAFASLFGIVMAWWAIAAMFSGSGDGNTPGGPKNPDGSPKAAWLDRLDRTRIRAEQRFADQPKELVAVLGDPRGQSWLPVGVMTGTIQSVRYSGDGRLIATLTSSGEARLWEAASLREVAALRGDAGYNNSIAFIDSDYFVMSNASGLVSIWDLTGKEVALKSRYRVPRTFGSLSANGRVAGGLVFDQERMQARGIIAWNVLDGVPNARDVVDVNGRGQFVTVSPTGKHLAVRYDANMGAFPVNQSLLIWDVAGKRAVATLSGVRMATAFGFSPDGKQLALAQQQQGLLLIETDTGRQRNIELNGVPLGLAFAPDNQTMFVSAGGMAVSVVDVNRGTVRASINVGDHVRTMEVAPDGRTLVTVGLRQDVKFWDVVSGRELGAIPAGLRATMLSMAFAPDGQTLALAGQDNSLRLFQARTGKELLPRVTQGAISLLAFLKDGKTLAAGSTFADDQRKGRAIRFYDLDSMQIGASLEDESSPQHNWVYSAARNQIVGESVTLDGGMIGSGMKFWDADTRKEGTGFSLGRAGFGFTPMAVSPDGKMVAYPRYSGATLVLSLLDASTGKDLDNLAIPQSTRPQQVAFSADGKHLAAVGYDRVLHIWDVPARKLLSINPSEQRVLDVTCFAFSPADNLLASATATKSGHQPRLTLWDLQTGNIKHQFEIQGAMLATIAFSADGKLVAASGADGKLTIWNTSSGEVVKDWTIPGPAQQLLFTPAGDGLLTGNANGTVYVFRLK